jgi:MoaA/NifB/PqqE/SkfB family radical SAM enzyme
MAYLLLWFLVMHFHRGLYALLFHELGRYDEFKERVRQRSKHPAFSRGRMRDFAKRRGMFVVWEDGGVHASNANAQPPLGHVPQESFEEIHERCRANGKEQDLPSMLWNHQDTIPKNEVCWTCLVRERCRGDNCYCWKLQRSVG